MSRNCYSEIYLHLVWHTKISLTMLTGDVEKAAHREIRKRVVKTPGAFIYEVDGTDDHVHCSVFIPPTIHISEWIGQLKGGSAHDVNKRLGMRGKVLEWQTGYGVVSFGRGDLDWINAYIRNQREYHARGTIHDRLERITQFDDDPGLVEGKSAGLKKDGAGLTGGKGRG